MEAAAGASECLRKLNQMSHNSVPISTRLQCPGRTKAARTQRAVQDQKPLSSITRRARKGKMCEKGKMSGVKYAKMLTGVN